MNRTLCSGQQSRPQLQLDESPVLGTMIQILMCVMTPYGNCSFVRKVDQVSHAVQYIKNAATSTGARDAPVVVIQS